MSIGTRVIFGVVGVAGKDSSVTLVFVVRQELMNFPPVYSLSILYSYFMSCLPSWIWEPSSVLVLFCSFTRINDKSFLILSYSVRIWLWSWSKNLYFQNNFFFTSVTWLIILPFLTFQKLNPMTAFFRRNLRYLYYRIIKALKINKLVYFSMCPLP